MSQKLTAVVIEDEKNICRFMESVPAGESYKILTASIGTEGLSVITSQCPDIIPLDLGLPDMDGKPEENPADPKYIFTEIGVGYRMREE